MIVAGTANERPHDSSTNALAMIEPGMLPTLWWARQIPMIIPLIIKNYWLEIIEIIIVVVYLPLLLFPNQLQTAATQPGHPVDWNKPATIYTFKLEY